MGLDKFGSSGAMLVDDFNGDEEFEIVNSIWDPKIGLSYYKRTDSGQFVDSSKQANFAGINGGLNVRHADFDNDGDLDLYVLRGAWLADKGRYPNSLLRNDGPGKDGVIRFTDVSYACGIAEPAYPAISAEWADYDLDGDLDLFVGNETDRRWVAPCQLFRNDGDGDLDVFEQMGGAFKGDKFFDAVYENPGFGNHWLEVRLRGKYSNSFGIGCRLRVVLDEAGTERSVYTWMNSGGSFGSNPLIAIWGWARLRRSRNWRFYGR